MLCNYLYDPKKTWGELESEVKEAAAVVKRLVQGVLAGAGMDEATLFGFGVQIDGVAAEFGVDVREPGWEEGFCSALDAAGMEATEEGIANYGASIDKAVRDGAEMRASPAKLVVEIQFMTKEYYAMRKKTHAWYKVLRAETSEGMLADYMGGL